MNAALQDYRAIWRAAILVRDRSALRTLYLVAGAVGACGAILVVLGDLSVLKTLRFMTAIAFMALALIWTFLFMPGAIRLNSPINAWLLPRQRRRLLEMTAAYWLVASLGITFGLGDSAEVRYFLEHAQYNGPVQALAAFINIQLPFQRAQKQSGYLLSPRAPSPANSSQALHRLDLFGRLCTHMTG